MELCEKYAELLATRRRLPAFKVKEMFLEQLENNRVLIIVGETGQYSRFWSTLFVAD
jgi:ATP-dependent RNA helicase DHX57